MTNDGNDDSEGSTGLTRRQRRRGWLIVATFAGMVVYVVLSHHQPSAAVIGCPFRWATGYSCFGCGMTRSTAHFLHGDLVEAFRHHPFGPFFVLGFAAAAAHALAQNLRGERLRYRLLKIWQRIAKPAWVAIMLVIVAFGVVRFVLEVSGFLTPI